MKIFNIGDYVDLYVWQKDIHRSGKIVDIIRKDTTPTIQQIGLYWGFTENHPQFGKIKNYPLQIDRYIVQKDDLKTYLIVPEVAMEEWGCIRFPKPNKEKSSLKKAIQENRYFKSKECLDFDDYKTIHIDMKKWIKCQRINEEGKLGSYVIKIVYEYDTERRYFSWSVQILNQFEYWEYLIDRAFETDESIWIRGHAKLEDAIMDDRIRIIRIVCQMLSA